MHFYRIFRAVTNQSITTYILERKLIKASIDLKNTDRKVVDIAFEYGFNSHEQFTRSFRKKFHVTPSRYRKKDTPVSLMEMDVLERDFKNENKDIIVNYHCVKLQETKLLGKEVSFDLQDPFEIGEAVREDLDFENEYVIRGTASRLFNVIRKDSGNPSRICFFCGIVAEEHFGDQSGLAEGKIPESRYAVFNYPGCMGSVWRTVTKDLGKLFRITELKFNNNAGIDMFELFTKDYGRTGRFYLYVPVL
jgi:AraC family transcriptional regulator